MVDQALRLQVRNILGVRTADLPLSGVNLIAGRNGAGKSSLLEAAACAMLQTARVRGITTKRAAASVVHHGAEEGVAALSGDGVPILRVRFPAAEIEQTGAPIPPISRAASGIASFIDLTPEQRMAEIIDRFEAKATREDLYQFLAQHEGTANLREIILREATDTEPARTALDWAVDAMFARTEESGWDAVWKSGRETNTKLKGQWEHASGRKYGSKVAREFLPPLLVPGETYSLPAHEAAVARAKARLEQLIAAGGVADHERTLLQEEADRLPVLEAEMGELESQAQAAEALLRKAVAEQNKPTAAIDVRALIVCPKCRANIRAIRVSTGTGLSTGNGTVYECVDLPSEAEQEQQAEIAREIQKRIDEGRKALEENGRAKAAKAMEIRASKDARNKIVASEGKPMRDEEAITAQREAVASAEAMMKAVEQYEGAKKIYGQIMQHTAFVEALEPSGVRMAVLRRKIDALNSELANVCTLAKFEPVSVETTDAEMEVFYGDRLAKLASKSERWRAEFAFAVVFAMRERSPVLLLDEFDIINNDDRAPVVMALKKLGLNALICMTAKARDKDVPNLKRANLGATWWMENGEMTPLEAAA